MFTAERHQAILELVRINGAVSMRDLATALDTSEVTVRRDLRALESQGLIDRRRGGAVSRGGLSHEQSYRQKSRVAAAEKAAIAELAAGLVGEGDAIVIGAGTTTQELARRLRRLSDLTVVTNSIPVAEVLAHSAAEVVVTGGSLRGSTFALVGSSVERTLAGLHVRRTFISGNGLTVARGLSTPNLASADVDQAMARAAEEVVVLVDHTKLGVETMFQTVAPHRITHLVTDDRADAASLDQLRELGVRVHVAVVPASARATPPA